MSRGKVNQEEELKKFFSFRILLKLSPAHRLGVNSEKWVLTPEGVKPEIVLSSEKKNCPISRSEELVIQGDGYSSPEEARVTGEQVRDSLARVFALFRIGADFGGFSPRKNFLNSELSILAKEKGFQPLDEITVL
jgi:hypothetical protein